MMKDIRAAQRFGEALKEKQDRAEADKRQQDLLATHNAGYINGQPIKRNDDGTYTSSGGQTFTQQQFDTMGTDAEGKPMALQFNSMIDPATGKLKDNVQLQAGADVQVDQRAIDEIRNRALEKGPSAWAKMAEEKQRIEETGALDNARAQSAGAQAQTLSNLMMRGGLQGGSRERIARGTLKDQMLAAQQVGRQGQLDRAGIGLQDQTFKNQFLNTTADLDFRNADLGLKNREYKSRVDEVNLRNLLGETQAERDFKMGTYKERMNTWGANKQADAMAKQGGGGKK